MVEDEPFLARQIFLVAISSSGKSPNVLNAISHANDCIRFIRPCNLLEWTVKPHLNGNRYEDNYIHIDSFNYGVYRN